MRTLLLGLVAVAALALAGTASAGGWATAGVNQPPDDPTAGSTWDAKITILQHGQTPLAGVSPTLTLIGEERQARDLPRQADRRDGRVRRVGEVPLGRLVELRGLRRLHAVRRRTAAHVRSHRRRRRLRVGLGLGLPGCAGDAWACCSRSDWGSPCSSACGECGRGRRRRSRRLVIVGRPPRRPTILTSLSSRFFSISLEFPFVGRSRARLEPN